MDDQAAAQDGGRAIKGDLLVHEVHLRGAGLIGLDVAEVTGMAVIGFWIVIQIFSGIGEIAASSQTEGGGVAYMAHIGGFIAGVALVYLLGKNRARLESGEPRRLPWEQ